jgi:DNA-directed RNA polymerase sigma subunit (sigma70/sigma32)
VEQTGYDSVFCDDPLRVYLAEIRRVPPLDRVEEIECIEHARTGDEMAEAAKTRLVEAHLELVVSLAERHRSEHVHILDLIQKGNEGLLRAAQTVAHCGSDSFASYATQLIERALDDARPAIPPNQPA